MAVRKSGFRKQSGKEGWVVDYRDLSGKRRQRTFETKREANAFEERVRAEKRAGTHVPDRASGTVGAAAESMLRAMREIPVAPATLSWYASIVKLHIMPFLGDQIIARMTPVSVHLWLDELRAEAAAAGTPCVSPDRPSYPSSTMRSEPAVPPRTTPGRRVSRESPGDPRWPMATAGRS